MKKYLFLLLLVGIVSCGGTSDSTLLDNHFKEYYAETYQQKELVWNEYTSRSTMPDTSKAYTIERSFASDENYTIDKNGSGWGGGLVKITTNYKKLGLRSSKVLSLRVNLSCSEANYSGTYEWKLEYSKYTDYFSEILRPKLYNASTSCQTGDKNGESYVQISGSTGTSTGMSYYHVTWTVNFNHGTFEYNRGSYKQLPGGSRYDEENTSIIYYFNSGTPRIEGMSIGTFYVGDYFYSDNTSDNFAYERFLLLNDIFKEMNDTEYITSIR